MARTPLGVLGDFLLRLVLAGDGSMEGSVSFPSPSDLHQGMVNATKRLFCLYFLILFVSSISYLFIVSSSASLHRLGA